MSRRATKTYKHKTQKMAEGQRAKKDHERERRQGRVTKLRLKLEKPNISVLERRVILAKLRDAGWGEGA